MTAHQPSSAPRLDAESRHRRYEEIFSDCSSPFAFVDLDAMQVNSERMLDRAGGKQIRVASKSLRCRAIMRMILASDDYYQGILAYTVPEALFLTQMGFEDIVVAYPCVDETALAELASVTMTDRHAAPVVMVDSIAHLDVIERACAKADARIRVCIDLDAGYWRGGGKLKLGPKRSPLHDPDEAAAFAKEIIVRPYLRLVGLMSYEGLVAGIGDNVPGQPMKNAAVRRLQSASIAELAERRAQAVAAIEHVRPLEFINGGGTGSLHTTSLEQSVTEIAAGSGFYAPTLFDTYSSFSLEPAAMFVLPIVRKPSKNVATALGGGYIASGPAGSSRLPSPYLPTGLKLDSQEGAGEVQTPLLGRAAKKLKIGDRVYMRHTKAGELCEHFNTIFLVRGDDIVDEVPTYRGEGRSFL